MSQHSDQRHNLDGEELLDYLLGAWAGHHRMRGTDVESVKLVFVTEQWREIVEEYEDLLEETLDLAGEEWQGQEYLEESLEYLQQVFEECGVYHQ